MRSRPVIVGVVATAALLGGVRLAARTLLAESVTTHSASHPCGALGWVTTGTTRQRPFEGTPRVESTSALLVGGVPVAEDVREVRCRFADGIAGVLAGPARDELRVYDTQSGALLRTLRFDAPIASTQWSPDGLWIAAESDPAAGVSRLEVMAASGETPARTLRSDPRLGPGYAWSSRGTLCWILVDHPASSPGSVDLECESAGAGVDGGGGSAPRGAHATIQEGDTAAPWVGFVGDAPHLCGSGLTPRDVECRGVRRPDEE